MSKKDLLPVLERLAWALARTANEHTRNGMCPCFYMALGEIAIIIKAYLKRDTGSLKAFAAELGDVARFMGDWDRRIKAAKLKGQN